MSQLNRIDSQRHGQLFALPGWCCGAWALTELSTSGTAGLSIPALVRRCCPAASLAYAVALWWRNRSAPQHLAAFGAAVAVLATGIDRIDPRAATFLFGIAIWVLAVAWGIAVSRGRLVPAPTGMLLSGAGALAGAIIAMHQTAGVLLAIATVAGLFACGVLTHQVPLIGLGAVGTLYVVPDAATRDLPGSVAAPLAVAVVGLVLLGVALWLARHRKKEPVGHAAKLPERIPLKCNGHAQHAGYLPRE